MKYLLPLIMLLLSLRFSYSQELQPTDDKALILLNVTDFKMIPIEKATVIFRSKTTQKEYKVLTNQNGKAQLLLPKGDTYKIQYEDFINRADYSEFELPQQAGRMTMTINIKYQPAKVVTLNNVYFDTDKATIKPTSYKQLNDIVNLMKMRKDLNIEISGHTDNQGSETHNMILSKNRADAVKKYLIQHGIEANRIQTKGYGSLHPIADNSTIEGRAKNRRIEVKILEN